MAIKVKAVERKLKFTKDENDPGVYRYVMQPELYTALAQDKVIREAALRSGVSKGVMQACWDAAGEVIKAWATEGHSVALPGLGTMRFGLRSKAVEDVNDVKSKLISSRRIIFTPNVDLKEDYRRADHLHRPHRQGGEARDLDRRRHRGGRERQHRPEPERLYRRWLRQRLRQRLRLRQQRLRLWQQRLRQQWFEQRFWFGEQRQRLAEHYAGGSYADG